MSRPIKGDVKVAVDHNIYCNSNMKQVRHNEERKESYFIVILFFGANIIGLPVADAGLTSDGKEVYLRDIWPSREEIQQTEEDTVISSIFKDLRERLEVRSHSAL